MIVFDLQCRKGGETFEAWFRSGSDYDEQLASGLVQCPICGATDIVKAPMAPRLPRTTSSDALTQLAGIQAEMLKNSRWVGEDFAQTARAMHAGEIEREQVHGTATIEQAKALVEEGVSVAPLPLPVLPPNQVN